MNYTVSINEKTRAITVTLPNGTKGTARCCPTDRFDINTGIELALERAKVKEKSKTAPKPKTPTVMELVKALEKALPKGQCVVVGNGVELTTSQKQWLHSLTGCGKVVTDETEYERGYGDGYEEGVIDGTQEQYVAGYDEGYLDGYAAGRTDVETEHECECDCECHSDKELETLASAIKKLLDGVLLN